MITGPARENNTSKQDIDVLISAISELQRNPPDKNKIKEGLLYLDNSAGPDLRKELRALLQKAAENDGTTITDL